jgi:hypothetical protein
LSTTTMPEFAQHKGCDNHPHFRTTKKQKSKNYHKEEGII